MHILHILDHSIPIHSGYTFRTRNILRQQRALGWRTSHVTGLKHKMPFEPEENVDGLHFYRTRYRSAMFSRIPVVNQWEVMETLSRRIEEIVEREHPDILHAHSPALNGMAALNVARKFKLPFVYECRAFWEDAAVDHGTARDQGVRYRVTRALETRVFRKADIITTICEGLKSDIALRGIPEEKITVIPNAVDTDQFQYSSTVNGALVKKWGLTGKTVLGFIGSFYAYEGIPMLVEGFGQLVRESPDIRLLLVGGGPQEEFVKTEVSRLGLQDVVIMPGRVSHSEVQDYYNLVDIFVYPRLPMRLTELVTPLKPLEAMASGKLVVASDVGGHRELIKHGTTGLLFKASCGDSLVSTIRGLLQSQSTWEQLRSEGRRFVENERTWHNSVAHYGPIYQRLVR